MSEGKFSQPRPHRDEERQIEESFRQLTEDSKRRRKKVYNVEEDIQKTVREITEVSLPQEDGLPFEKSAKLDPTAQMAPDQLPPQPPVAPPRPPRPQQPPQQTPQYDLIPEDVDGFFDGSSHLPEEAFPEREPDFIDKLMDFGAFFKKHQTPVILGLCAAAVALIVLFVSIFFTGGKADEKEVLAGNIYIAGVNINGRNKAQAVDAVKQVTDLSYRHNDMVVDLGTTQLTLSPKDTGAQLDVEAAVEAAFALEPSQEHQYIALLPYMQLNTDYIYNTLEAYAKDTGSTLTQTSYGLEGSEPELSADKYNANAPTQTLVIVMGTPGIGFDVKDVYEKVLDAYSLHSFQVTVENVQSVSEPEPIDLEAVYKEFYIEPKNASINMQNFQTIPGTYGYEFDLAEAKRLVENAQYGEVLRLPMRYIEPDILDNDSFFQDILGEAQTRGTGNEDRNRNLSLACAAINGTVLNPGESLSFRNLLSRTSGFRVAPEDAGQEDVEQGGVTQVASTLYYAALASDLNITSRSSHGYLPSFIDYGLDATADLSILNSTGYPIRIEAEYTGGYARVKILGTEERSYYVMLESSIASATAPLTIYEDFEHDNAEGYEDGDIIQEGTTGYLVKSYKVKYDRQTGREQSRDFIANSQYPSTDTIVARVAPPETEPPTEPPTEAPTVPPTTVPPTTVPPTTVPPTTVPPTEAPTVAPETTAATEPSTEAPVDPVIETQPEAVSQGNGESPQE